MGNLSPIDKIAKLKGNLNQEIQNLPYVRKFIEDYETDANDWNKEKILNRANKMAIEAYNKVWKIN